MANARSNCLGDAAVRDICTALLHSQTPLTTLNLGGNCISDAGAVELSQFVGNCPVRGALCRWMMRGWMDELCHIAALFFWV